MVEKKKIFESKKKVEKIEEEFEKIFKKEKILNSEINLFQKNLFLDIKSSEEKILKKLEKNFLDGKIKK